MPVHSILFPEGVPPGIEDVTPPTYLGDLNLDQIIAGLTRGKDDYRLTPFFSAPLSDLAAVTYRQDVFRDLECREVRDLVDAFAQPTLAAKHAYRAAEMRTSRRDFAHFHRARWFLNAALQYCDTVASFTAGLTEAPVESRGLVGLRDYLTGYIASEAFTVLRREADWLKDALDAVRYCVVAKGDRVIVGPYSGEVDYSAQVTATFERFRQDTVTSSRAAPSPGRDEDFAELAILDLVAKLYPDPFAELDRFCTRHADYLDATVALADREFQFYLSYLDYIQPLREKGVAFSYPRLSTESKAERVTDTFDLALGAQLTAQGGRVVGNDLTLAGPERILVISGPNNGGKTTLARAFGQLHFLAALGCPVPGRDAELFLCDQIFTHFEKAEDIATLAGKLQEELTRMRAALDAATSSSVLILNEVFNSTTAADALFLSRKILQRISDLDALAVCVTFLDELSTLNDTTVSMVSQVDPEDPAIRTHKVIRVAADGRAYARAIARKYELTYEQISARRTAS